MNRLLFERFDYCTASPYIIQGPEVTLCGWLGYKPSLNKPYVIQGWTFWLECISGNLFLMQIPHSTTQWVADMNTCANRKERTSKSEIVNKYPKKRWLPAFRKQIKTHKRLNYSWTLLIWTWQAKLWHQCLWQSCRALLPSRRSTQKQWVCWQPH